MYTTDHPSRFNDTKLRQTQNSLYYHLGICPSLKKSTDNAFWRLPNTQSAQRCRDSLHLSQPPSRDSALPKWLKLQTHARISRKMWNSNPEKVLSLAPLVLPVPGRGASARITAAACRAWKIPCPRLLGASLSTWLAYGLFSCHGLWGYGVHASILHTPCKMFYKAVPGPRSFPSWKSSPNLCSKYRPRLAF